MSKATNSSIYWVTLTYFLAFSTLPLAQTVGGAKRDNQMPRAKADLTLQQAAMIAKIRGDAEILTDNYTQAIEYYTEAIHIDSQHVPAYAGRAGAYVMLNDFARAIDDYNSALLIEPKNPRLYVGRASAKAQKDLDGDALSDLNKAIQLNPSYAEAFTRRGLVYMKLRRRADAARDIKTAIRLGDPIANKIQEALKLTN